MVTFNNLLLCLMTFNNLWQPLQHTKLRKFCRIFALKMKLSDSFSPPCKDSFQWLNLHFLFSSISHHRICVHMQMLNCCKTKLSLFFTHFGFYSCRIDLLTLMNIKGSKLAPFEKLHSTKILPIFKLCLTHQNFMHFRLPD